MDMISLSMVICIFSMRPLSVTFYRYVIAHQIKTAKLAYEFMEEDEDDGYPWDLY
jgi:hypothetical protein